MSTLTGIVTLACCAAALRAEVHTMNLRQAVERALQQNPEIAMARLDEMKAQEALRVQKDPFAPHVYFGSGLAYTNGFPMSIDGAAPSVVQGHASQFLFNRQQSYVVARTKEEARGAGIAASAKKDDVAFRTAELFLDAERAKPPACRAWTWWRSMVCSPPSTTTRIISSNTSATMVRSAFRSCSRSCWGRA